MKTIIDFIKKYWKGLAIGLCVLLLIIMTMCGNANYKKNQDVIFKSELINAKETLRDSMVEANNIYNRHVTDSIQKSEKIVSDAAIKKANDLQKESNRLTKENKLLQGAVDSLLNVYGDSLDTNCKKVLYAYQKQVNGLKADNFVLNKAILQLRIAHVADSTGWAACKKQNISDMETIKSKNDLLVSRNNVITDLQKQLGKQNNWLNKNKGWIGLGIGIVGGILIMK